MGRTTLLCFGCRHDANAGPIGYHILVMLALLAAMKEEIAGIRERMLIEESLERPGCRIYAGSYRSKPVVLAQTGIGKDRVQAATRAVLERYPVDILVSMGIAGALMRSLRVGDVFICAQLATNLPPGDSVAALHCHSAAGLVALASEALMTNGVKFVTGKSLSVLEAIIEPEHKQGLADDHEAGVVDMESFWAAGIASEYGIPFLAVRVVSDTSYERIPDFGQFTKANGDLKAREAGLYFFKHPIHLLYMIRMWRNVARAKSNLRLALQSIIDLVPEDSLVSCR